ncbi:hypothetical protein [uncultured Microbulbifer sp.]|uniref:hypothetical protein n=1 Tax=uncultured Microbulbifer sp. TaxID=348147 RepID=UPI002636C6D4|nr:hypothetical protein [uncultured Microbulbifer sp.]
MITEMFNLRPSLWEAKREVEVSERIYWYYLEVLPPVDMGLRQFVFQEGGGARLIFHEDSTRFTCALLSDCLVTKDFKYHITITRNRCTENFEIKGIFSGEFGKELPPNLFKFSGQSFSSPAAIEKGTGLNFRV